MIMKYQHQTTDQANNSELDYQRVMGRVVITES